MSAVVLGCACKSREPPTSVGSLDAAPAGRWVAEGRAFEVTFAERPLVARDPSMESRGPIATLERFGPLRHFASWEAEVGDAHDPLAVVEQRAVLRSWEVTERLDVRGGREVRFRVRTSGWNLEEGAFRATGTRTGTVAVALVQWDRGPMPAEARAFLDSLTVPATPP